MNERRADIELLRSFSRRGDQDAFADIVRRHIDLVYATALRKVEGEAAAEEVAQNVLATLARKAWQFAPDDSIPAWLYRTTLLESKEWWRAELRRRRREQIAAELGTTMKNPQEQSAFRALVPLLDDALLSLREKDREALLLRYYESRSLREVGASLGVSEDAAQKRVTVALQQLERFFQRRGFRTATVAAAAAALEHTAASASAATVHLVVRAALQSAPPALAGLPGLFARVAGLTKVQKALVGVTLVMAPLAWHWSASHRIESATVAPVEPPPRVAATAPPPLASLPVTPPIVVVETNASPSALAVVVPLRSEASDSIQLRGVVNLPDCRAAFLEISFRTGPRSNNVAQTNHLILKEGESVEQDPFKGGRLVFELRQVDMDSGRIQARENGEDAQFTVAGPDESWLPPASPPGGKPTLGLRNADFCDVLELYGTFLGRTVLCHPKVNSAPLDLVASARDRASAARAIEKVLKERGIGVAPLGERFELIASADRVQSILKTAESGLGSRDDEAPTLPVESIRLENVPWRAVIGLYGDLVSRQWQGNNPPSGSLLFLHNQTPLTKPEVLYAFDTLLRWEGFKVSIVDERTFRLVRVAKP